MLRYKARILAKISECPSEKLHSKPVPHHEDIKTGERVTWNQATPWLILVRKVSAWKLEDKREQFPCEEDRRLPYFKTVEASGEGRGVRRWTLGLYGQLQVNEAQRKL